MRIQCDKVKGDAGSDEPNENTLPNLQHPLCATCRKVPELIETKTRPEREWMLDLHSSGVQKHNSDAMIMLLRNCWMIK